MNSQKLIQTALVALLAITLCKTLSESFIGQIVLGVLVLAAVLMATVIWLIKCRPETILKMYGHPWPRKVIDVICSLGGMQPPRATARTATYDPLDEHLRLRTAEDMRAFDEYLRDLVFGHDHVIPKLLDHIRSAVELRRTAVRRENLPPLVSVLMAGPAHVGKAHLAGLVAANMFTDGGVAHVSFLDGLTEEVVLNQLVERVRGQPFSCLIVEGVSAASVPTQRMIEQVLGHGQPLMSPSGTRVTFQNCLWFFIEALDSDVAETLVQKQGVAVSSDAVAGHVLMVDGLRDSLSIRLVLQALSDRDCGTVALDLLRRESAKYEMPLSHVATAIVADLARLVQQHGPARAQASLVNTVKRAAAKARETGASSLRVTSIE